MTGLDPSALPPPALTEYRARCVTWEPWRPGFWSSLDFHYDTRCPACGHRTSATEPRAVGLVHHDGEEAAPDTRTHRDQRGRVAAVTTHGCKPKPPTRELGASTCPGCRMVTVVHLLDPDWWWTSAPVGELDLQLEGRRPEPPPRTTRGRSPRRPPTPAPPRPPQLDLPLPPTR